MYLHGPKTGSPSVIWRLFKRRLENFTEDLTFKNTLKLHKNTGRVGNFQDVDDQIIYVYHICKNKLNKKQGFTINLEFESKNNLNNHS